MTTFTFGHSMSLASVSSKVDVLQGTSSQNWTIHYLMHSNLKIWRFSISITPPTQNHNFWKECKTFHQYLKNQEVPSLRQGSSSFTFFYFFILELEPYNFELEVALGHPIFRVVAILGRSSGCFWNRQGAFSSTGVIENDTAMICPRLL